MIGSTDPNTKLLALAKNSAIRTSSDTSAAAYRLPSHRQQLGAYHCVDTALVEPLRRYAPEPHQDTSNEEPSDFRLGGNAGSRQYQLDDQSNPSLPAFSPVSSFALIKIMKRPGFIRAPLFENGPRKRQPKYSLAVIERGVRMFSEASTQYDSQ